MDSPKWDQNPAAIYIPKRDEDHPHLFYMGVPPNSWESCLLGAVGQTWEDYHMERIGMLAVLRCKYSQLCLKAIEFRWYDFCFWL